MKKVIPVFFVWAISLLCFKNATAQLFKIDRSYYTNPWFIEAGFSLNAMNCIVDLGSNKVLGKGFIKDVYIKGSQVGSGVFFSAMYQNAVALRLEGTFGQISRSDSDLDGINDIASKNRNNRNLNFRTNINEISSLIEIHPLNLFREWSSEESNQQKLSPYLLGGIGYFSFNPQAKLGNIYVDLHPLKTEGQGFLETGKQEYALTQLNIPFGGGIKYEITPLINLRLEFLYRKLFTDYLDDVSESYIDPSLFSKYLSPQKATLATLLSNRQIQPVSGDVRGGPAKDSYFSTNLKISVTIGRKRDN